MLTLAIIQLLLLCICKNNRLNLITLPVRTNECRKQKRDVNTYLEVLIEILRGNNNHSHVVVIHTLLHTAIN